MDIIYCFYIVTVFFLIGMYFIGDTIQKLAKVRLENRHHHVLTSLFWGIMSLVTIYSLVKTGGVTISIFYIPLLIAFVYLGRMQKIAVPSISEIDSVKWTDVIIYWAIFTVYFVVNAIRITNVGEDFIFIIPQQDIIFYLENADSLNRYGQENYYNSLNYFPEFRGTTPYHYFELWIIAFLSFVAGESTIYGFQICTLPLFQLLLFIPVVGYLKSKRMIVNVLVAFLITFISGYVPNALRGYGHLIYSEALQMYGFIYMYVGVYFLFMMTSLAYQRSFLLSFLIVVSLAVATFTTFPAIIGGVALFAVLNLLNNKKINQFLTSHKYIKYSPGEYLIVLAYTLFIGLGILIFYRITGNKIENDSLNIFKMHFLSADYILAIKNIIGRPFILIVIPLLYLFVTVYVFYRKSIVTEIISNNIFLVFLLGCIASFTAFLMLYEHPDSFQLFRNFTTIALYVFFIYLLIQVINGFFTKIEWKHLFLVPLFLLLCFNVYENSTTEQFTFKHDSSYIGKIVRELDSNETPVNCAFVSNSDTTKNEISITFFHRNMNKHAYVRYSQKCMGVYQINDFYRYVKNKFALEISKKTSVFLRFREKNKIKELGLAQYEFMKGSNVKYFIVQAGEPISPFLQTKLTLLFRDPVSGDAFYKVL